MLEEIGAWGLEKRTCSGEGVRSYSPIVEGFLEELLDPFCIVKKAGPEHMFWLEIKKMFSRRLWHR